MGRRGPKPVSPQDLYFFAEEFYRDFRRLAEGSLRLVFDAKHYQQLKQELEREGFQLDAEAQENFQHRHEQIRVASLTEAEKEKRLRDLQERQMWAMREGQIILAQEESRKELPVPAKPDVLQGLMGAKTAEEVREICKGAFALRKIEVFDPATSKSVGYRDVEVRQWPIASGSMFPRYLSQYAEQFIAAKEDPRFPRSSRPTNLLKQFWFLSRAIAGAFFEIQTRTAINLVGSKRPEEIFEESRAAKWERVRTKRKRRS
jgi:hypothetical protein